MNWIVRKEQKKKSKDDFPLHFNSLFTLLWESTSKTPLKTFNQSSSLPRSNKKKIFNIKKISINIPPTIVFKNSNFLDSLKGSNDLCDWYFTSNKSQKNNKILKKNARNVTRINVFKVLAKPMVSLYQRRKKFLSEKGLLRRKNKEANEKEKSLRRKKKSVVKDIVLPRDISMPVVERIIKEKEKREKIKKRKEKEERLKKNLMRIMKRKDEEEVVAVHISVDKEINSVSLIYLNQKELEQIIFQKKKVNLGALHLNTKNSILQKYIKSVRDDDIEEEEEGEEEGETLEDDKVNSKKRMMKNYQDEVILVRFICNRNILIVEKKFMVFKGKVFDHYKECYNEVPKNVHKKTKNLAKYLEKQIRRITANLMIIKEIAFTCKVDLHSGKLFFCWFNCLTTTNEKDVFHPIKCFNYHFLEFKEFVKKKKVKKKKVKKSNDIQTPTKKKKKKKKFDFYCHGCAKKAEIKDSGEIKYNTIIYKYEEIHGDLKIPPIIKLNEKFLSLTNYLKFKNNMEFLLRRALLCKNCTKKYWDVENSLVLRKTQVVPQKRSWKVRRNLKTAHIYNVRKEEIEMGQRKKRRSYQDMGGSSKDLQDFFFSNDGKMELSTIEKFLRNRVREKSTEYVEKDTF